MRAAMALALACTLGASPARAATFQVTNTSDSGVGSLRQAIADANLAAGADTISFLIVTMGIPTITPATALPALTGPVTIDGTTQVPAGRVELDGQATTSAVGLSIGGGSSTVRGLVIHGFESAAILVTGAGNNSIEGNLLGTDTSGTQVKSPLAYGVEISGSPANHITDNLLSGNLFGIFIHGSAAIGNVIEGNLIGTDLGGMVAVPNSSAGIWIFGAGGTIIGGTTAGTGNVISGNAVDGIDIGGAGAIDTVIAGNTIGFGVDGTTPTANAHDAIYIYAGAGRSTIGDTAANSIGSNGGAGIRVDTTGGTRNAIRGNAIVGNGGLGIDLGAEGVTANDAGDADGGANGQQNFPVLDATFVGGTQVAGTLDSVAGASFVVEIFATSACDGSGHGEGEDLLAVQPVITDGTGHADFTATLSRVVDASAEHLTATATDSLGNTSEFSLCTPATLLPTTTTSTTTTSSTTTDSAPATTSTTDGGSTSTTTTSTTLPDATTTTTAPTPTTTSTTASSTTSTTDAGGTTTTSTTEPDATTTTTTDPTPTTTSTTAATSSTTATTASTTTSILALSTTSTTDAGGTTTTSTTLPGATTTTVPEPSTTSTTDTTSSTTTTSAPTSTSEAPSSTTSTTDAGGTTTTSTTLPGATTTTVPEPSTTSTTDTTSSTTTTSAPTTSTSEAPSSTTTTTTTTTTLAVPSTITSSTGVTTTTATTTSTTLAGCVERGTCGCTVEATFGSIRCRLALLDASLPGTDLGDVRSRVARQLAQAGRLLDRADARCAKAKAGPARRKLMKASRRLARVVRVARPRFTGRALPVSVETFVGGATALVGDTRTLARGLACPDSVAR